MTHGTILGHGPGLEDHWFRPTNTRPCVHTKVFTKYAAFLKALPRCVRVNMLMLSHFQTPPPPCNPIRHQVQTITINNNDDNRVQSEYIQINAKKSNTQFYIFFFFNRWTNKCSNWGNRDEEKSSKTAGTTHSRPWPRPSNSLCWKVTQRKRSTQSTPSFRSLLSFLVSANCKLRSSCFRSSSASSFHCLRYKKGTRTGQVEALHHFQCIQDVLVKLFLLHLFYNNINIFCEGEMN